MKMIFLFLLFPYVISNQIQKRPYQYLYGNQVRNVNYGNQVALVNYGNQAGQANYVNQRGYGNYGKSKQNLYEDQTQGLSENLRTVLKSWMESDVSLRKFSENSVQAILPYAFQLFTSSGLTADCSKDLVNFLRGIAETKAWAYQMLDSFGKIPGGILGGTVSSLGSYDTCLNVTLPNNLFIGKYCLVDIEIPLPEQQDFHHWKEGLGKVFDLSHNDTIFSEFLSWEEKLYILHPRTAICIPSTCTTEDARHLAKTAVQLAGFQFNTNVKHCDTRQDPIDVWFSDLSLMILLCSVFFTVILATLIDFYQRATTDISLRKEEGTHWFLSFSLFINTERLVKKDDSPDSIRAFHGMRVLTMFWLIFTHVAVVDRVEPFGGYKKYFELGASFMGQLSSSGVLGVETFFFMSSTLLSYHIVKAAEEKMSVGLLLVKRYIRMTIPHSLMIAVTLVLPYIFSGPLYKEIIGREVQNCKERSWMNFLYIENFIPFTKICMGNTWYLAVDTQLFLTGLLIVVPLRKNPKTAILCIIALFFAGEIGTFISHIVYELPPTVLSIDPKMEYMEVIMLRSYFMPHFHLPLYCIGLLVGYLLALKKDIRISMKVNVALWIATLSIMFSIVFGTYFWNKESEPPGMLPSILYGCTHRILWGLCLAWVTIACQTNHGGVIASFLGSEGFVILSRVTFMAYLTNFTIKYLYIGTTSNVIVYNSNVIVNIYFSIVIATFLASFVMTLFIEAPFMNLEKALMDKLKGRKVGKGK